MKNPLILVLLLLSFVNFEANCQDTTFYNKKGKEVASIELAEKYSVVTYKKDKKDEATEGIFDSSGQKKSETFYSSF